MAPNGGIHSPPFAPVKLNVEMWALNVEVSHDRLDVNTVVDWGVKPP